MALFRNQQVAPPPPAQAPTPGLADTLSLTQDQQDALTAILQWLRDPNEPFFVLEGFAGTGKSTLIAYLLDYLPRWEKMIKLIDPSFTLGLTPTLTATTNKAAEALEDATGQQVSTIFSFLGLRVDRDPATGNSKLVRKRNEGARAKHLLIVDEISFANRESLDWIRKGTRDCKILLLGDPAQLAPVGWNSAPAFHMGFPTVRLTELVRQADDSPLADLVRDLRNAVVNGTTPTCEVNGDSIVWLDRGTFDQAVLDDMRDPAWRHNTSKYLAWTNRSVLDYNNGLRDLIQGKPQFVVGDYATNNSYVSDGVRQIKTDAMVRISDMGSRVTRHGITGVPVELNGNFATFFPDDWTQVRRQIRELRKQSQFSLINKIESSWVDLRSLYACTVNKSQGSTYDRVFVDLDDIGKCNNLDTLRRLLYVGVSRARNQVIFTGDLV